MLIDLDTDYQLHPTNAMSSSHNFFNNSPTVVMHPPEVNPFFGNNGHYAPQQQQQQQQFNNNSTLNGISPNGFANANAFMSNTATSNSLAGRKRSRGDIFSADDEDEQLQDGSSAAPSIEESPKPRGKPCYGPGMQVLYEGDPGYAQAAESQSGTWVEEREARRSLAQTKRPSYTSRKSQRMDSGAIGPDDLAQLVLPPQIREVTSEPLIDEATRRLGISWTRMNSTEYRQINERAYSKWIQKHYPALTEVSIWFENSSIPGYLVAAIDAYSGMSSYYIFSDDLTEARLVTTDPSQLIPRLEMLPALHLAAPGGCIRAETDPITAAQNELNGAMLEDAAYESFPNGCAAHAMEMD